jgi:hypothetical protein
VDKKKLYYEKWRQEHGSGSKHKTQFCTCANESLSSAATLSGSHVSILRLLASKNYDKFLNRIQRQIQINIEKHPCSNNLTKKQPRI